MVLWTVAALALFSSSIGGMIRQDAQVTHTARMVLQGRALAEAAIYEVLGEMQAEAMHQGRAVLTTERRMVFGSVPVEVSIAPWTGLINVNAASERIFAALLQNGCGLDSSKAAVIAKHIVQAREQLRNQNIEAWESIEDLLHVPSMHYGQYICMAPYLVADRPNQSVLSAQAMPANVREWLGSEATTASASSDRYRIVASVSLDEEGFVVLERDVVLRASGMDQLPWILLAARQTWRSAANQNAAL